MKQLVCFLFLSATCCSAQNWQPLNKSNQYTYFTSSAFSSATVIKTDSTGLQGSDSVFFLNRVVAPVSGNVNHKLINQGQFLGKKLVERSSGLLTFMGTKDFTLNIYARLGDSWIFDTARGYTATIIQLKYDTLFGQQDSMKVVSVSNMDTIVFSKNFGIVSFRDSSSSLTYSLKGIQNLNLGYHIPMFADIYTFNVGDVFQYRKLNYNDRYPDGSLIYNDYYWYKYTITSKTITGNQFQYTANNMETDTVFDLSVMRYAIHHSSGSINLSYTDSTTAFPNACKGQDVVENDLPYDQNGLNKVHKAMYFSYNNTFQKEVKMDNGQYLVPYKADTVTSETSILYYDYDYQSQAQYAKGIGAIYSFSGTGMYMGPYFSTEIKLVGCIKGGMTYGTVLPDSFFSLDVIQPAKFPANYNAYPSLLKDGEPLHITGHGQACTVQIYSADGRLVLSTLAFTDGKSDAEIDLGKLGGGMYVVRFLDISGVVCTSKFIRN